MGMLDGKVALITGASSGIGRATAAVMAAHGASMVIAARREDESNAVVEEIVSNGGDATFIKTDVTDEAQVEAAVRHAVDTYGALNCAVNNAGGGYPVSGEWHEQTPEAMDRLYDLNVRAMWLCMKHEIARMLSQDGAGGSIVNTSSIVGLRASPGEAYGSSKYAVNGLTTSAAARYGTRGIRVNAVAPGIINAGVWRRRFAEEDGLRDAWGEAIPAGRPGEPEEVGEAIAWLCSDWSSYVTGVTVPVDGGNAITINAP
jgi:A-factor type gamma-butyrolactone 1'-reductase (1S-forming)